MQGVPESAIDELQKGELRRSQDAAPEARRAQNRHEARRGEMMRVHDLDGPDGRLGLRQNPIRDGERLRIEGERFLGAVAAVGLVDGQALRQETEKARRLIPPLSSDGNFAIACSSSTNFSTSTTRSCASASGTRSSCSRYATLSSTVIESNSALSWNTIPTCARIAYTSRSVIPDSFLPKIEISPLSGSIKSLASFSSVLLPQPAGPKIIRVSPRSTLKEISRNTSFWSNPIDTSLNSTTGTPSGISRTPPALIARLAAAIIYRPKMPIIICVTRKSHKIISTDDTTTAWVVARPTPRVPPVVVRP